MRRSRNLLWTFLVAMFVASMVVVPPISAPSNTTLSVEPPSIIDPNLVKGTTFSVDIVVTDVVDLYGYEFKLGYNTAVLTATGITFGDFFPSPTFPPGTPDAPTWILKEEINDAEGYVHYAVMLKFGTPPEEAVSGSGTLATVDFTVDGPGGSVLDLYETKLGDSYGYPIPHEVYDGRFSNIGEAPIAIFTFEPELPEKDEIVTFNASASYDPDGTIVSYFWDFGDGTNDTRMIVDHVYDEIGIYTVTLNVTDDAALTSQASATIEVTAPKISKADLAEWGARPEHRRHDISKHGTINTFYAEVQSLGYEPVTVKVRFTIYSARIGGYLGEFETSEYPLQNYLDVHVFDTSTDVSPAEFDTDVWGTGRFYVKVQCFYWDPDVGDWIGGSRIKSFSFAVVP